MSVPKFCAFMLPILRQLADGEPRHWREVRKGCVAEFQFAELAMAEEISGYMSRADNRIVRSNTYLFHAGQSCRSAAPRGAIGQRVRSTGRLGGFR